MQCNAMANLTLDCVQLPRWHCIACAIHWELPYFVKTLATTGWDRNAKYGHYWLTKQCHPSEFSTFSSSFSVGQARARLLRIDVATVVGHLPAYLSEDPSQSSPRFPHLPPE
jgi:hypothetical protein